MIRFCLLALLLTTSLSSAQEKATPKKSTPLSEARQRLLRGNYEEARAAYGKHLGDEKLAPQAAIGIARAWLQEGDSAKALSALDEALKKASGNPDLLAEKAEILYRTGQWDEASSVADAILKDHEDHFRARWVRARLLNDRGERTKADPEVRWFIRTYVARDNDDKPIQDPDELLIVGEAGAENARRHGLGDQFRFLVSDLYPDVLKFEPDSWQAECAIGMLLLEKYNRPEASSAFDNALKINPKAAEAMLGKGRIAFQQFEMKEAENQADQALKVNPNLSAALRLKADVLLMGGDIEQASTLMAKAKKINPREEATLARLAACARLKNQPEQLKQVVAEVEKFNPKPGFFYYELGNVLDDRKYYTDAETYLRKSVDLLEKLPAPRAALGMLYMRLGKEEEGRKLLEAAFKSDSFNVRVSNSLKVLKHLDGYETIKTAHYDLRYDPKTDKILAETLAEYLEEVHAQLAKDFGYEPQERILMELFNNHEMFSGRTVGLPDLHTIGACTGKVVTMASPKGQGLTRPFNWGRVVRHELVHIFNLLQTDFLVPHWLTEGLAVRNEGGNRPPQWNATLRARFEKDDLLTLDNVLLAFVRPRSQDEWGLAYCQSNLYVEYVIKTYGLPAIGGMLNAYRDGLDDAAALKRVCKVDKADFEKGYKAYVAEVVKAIPSPKKKTTDKPMTLAELEKAHAKAPDDLDLAARLADQYARRKKSADARKLVDGVLAKEATHPLASIVKARLLSLAGEEEASKELIEKASQAHPDDIRLMLMIGRLAMENKEWNRASEIFEKGRKNAPLDGDWIPLLMEVYAKTGDTDKLTNVLKEQIANDPDDLKSRLTLTQILLKEKKYAEALPIALDATHIDTTHAEAQKNLLEALEGAGNKEEAVKLRKRFGE